MSSKTNVGVRHRREHILRVPQFFHHGSCDAVRTAGEKQRTNALPMSNGCACSSSCDFNLQRVHCAVEIQTTVKICLNALMTLARELPAIDR